MKSRLYIDTGANINSLKEVYPYVEFYQFPYDSSNRNKRLIQNGTIKLATPSLLQWRDANVRWNESLFQFQECTPSERYADFKKILEQNSKKPIESLRRDILHLDSAYKTGCKIFITSDNKDIVSKRKELEEIGNFKIFRSPQETDALISYIKHLHNITF